jgi:hypothetical protein
LIIIVVPNKFLNRNLILKVNIMKKNNLNFMNKEDYSLMDIYTTSIYNDVTEFTILKTLFKEIKIIRPLNIAKIKQLDLNPEVSLIEIKIENITSSINFIDRSLKNSKFLNVGRETDIVTYGIDLTLRDIQILKEETAVLNKTVIYFKNQEQSKMSLSKESINLDNLNFVVINNVKKIIFLEN